MPRSFLVKKGRFSPYAEYETHRQDRAVYFPDLHLLSASAFTHQYFSGLNRLQQGKPHVLVLEFFYIETFCQVQLASCRLTI